MDTSGNINALDFIVSHSERKSAVLALDAVQNENKPFDLKYRIKTLKRNEKFVECVGNVIEFGFIPAILLSVRDITGQIEAENALKDSEKRLRMLFKHTPVSLAVVSREGGVFVDVNRMFEESFGYSQDEVIGKTVEELGLIEPGFEWDAFYSALREGRQVRGMELCCRRRSGEICICRLSSAIIMIDNRPCILCSVEDITDIGVTDSA